MAQDGESADAGIEDADRRLVGREVQSHAAMLARAHPPWLAGWQQDMAATHFSCPVHLIPPKTFLEKSGKKFIQCN
jgi:hypothetical protein